MTCRVVNDCLGLRMCNLGLRAGNAVILRGGSEAVESNRAIHTAMVRGITAVGLPAEAVQLVPTTVSPKRM